MKFMKFLFSFVLVVSILLKDVDSKSPKSNSKSGTTKSKKSSTGSNTQVSSCFRFFEQYIFGLKNETTFTEHEDDYSLLIQYVFLDDLGASDNDTTVTVDLISFTHYPGASPTNDSSSITDGGISRELGSITNCKRCGKATFSVAVSTTPVLSSPRLLTKTKKTKSRHESAECETLLDDFPKYFENEDNRNKFSEDLNGVGITNSGVSKATKTEVKWTYFLGKGYPNETPVNSNEELMTMLPGIPFIVRRLCPNCLPSHQDIYYRRLTPLPEEGFNLLDTLMNNWISYSNLLNVDFTLHSTYEDAVLGVNGWEICNYDDPGVGFPRDCGPKELIQFQWNSYGPDYYSNPLYSTKNPVTAVHAFFYYIESA